MPTVLPARSSAFEIGLLFRLTMWNVEAWYMVAIEISGDFVVEIARITSMPEARIICAPPVISCWMGCAVPWPPRSFASRPCLAMWPPVIAFIISMKSAI